MSAKSWDLCAALSCHAPRAPGRPYCPECLVMFAGERPPERKPMPVVEVVESLVQPATAATPVPKPDPSHPAGLPANLSAAVFAALLAASFLRQGPRGFLARLGLQGRGPDHHASDT